ncbi:unnamed protein product [Acanthoscelides obtectus]|uniref:CRK SH3-binding GNRP n=1 Tax=Acanthoscelides obtectus TaxID=200917 RepID=A0A9P0M255_ACAOB|nr:unnamed protein product [Acanthoscelides obtectus]CAK1636095.1 Guanine nucleotide-releasing factor 2 [Acanthoscelides obtectus]
MRAPNSTGAQPSPKTGTAGKLEQATITAVYAKGPEQELEDLWRQTQVALKHFRDVVSKQKLEMLPGNGTIVLDTVWLINLAVKSSVAGDAASNGVKSATRRMYQSVARLIKLCDDVLIDSQSSELDIDNVGDIVTQVEVSVKELIELAQKKISEQQHHHSTPSYKTGPRTSYSNIEATGQRNSLPDIPLTPREMEILQRTAHANPVRGSHSTESILRDSSPPPKPPLPESLCRSDPNTSLTPPPLPPKKKNFRLHRLIDECYSDHSPMTTSLERVSMRSKSPEDSISLLSESAGSVDSVLNNSSREEDEIRALMDGDDIYFDNHTSDIFGGNGSTSWEESSLSSSISNHASEHHLHLHQAVSDYRRLSNADSGVATSSSARSSSYSKRSSQQSAQFTAQSVTVTSSSVQQTKSSTEMIKSESILQGLNRSFENHLTLKNFSESTSSSSSVTVVSNSTNGASKSDVNEDVPPAIPQKTKRKTADRQLSPYDNVPDEKIGGELLVTCEKHQSSHHSVSNSTSISSSMIETDGSKPPPLPPKKKHMFQSVAYSVMAYMEMFGNCTHTNDQEFMRHSVHMVQSQYSTPLTQTITAGGMSSTQSCSFSHSSHLSNYSSSSHSSATRLHGHAVLGVPPRSDDRSPSPVLPPSPLSTTSTGGSSDGPPPALPPKQRPRRPSARSPPPAAVPPPVPRPPPSVLGDGESKPSSPVVKSLPDLLEHTTKNDEQNSNKASPCEDLMEMLNVDEYLLLKKTDEDGPDIRGGHIDALIIQATKATKNGVFMYQEAFLTTYRTFITPYDLISKLMRRYNYFYYQPDKKPRSREAFALIVRVVSDLTSLDLDKELQLKLMNFVQQLISCGELTLAKALRVKLLQRHEAKEMLSKYTNIVTSLSLNARNFTLFDFKSEQIAEQMTLLDAELFMKIEIPEVLIWAQEQNEERSPNLTMFTEHFNKMSYWARTKILTAENKDTREKYFTKFIKIMKHLRKINNFNSYLALLSALDSAPVRRLEWQKQVQEGLKEYCALIDSSSSFRAYRQALAETQPPCIPYIGLVLQDLTFVHIGNPNLLPDGSINFSKRWQQFNIVENMKKFNKATYTFKRQEKIINFFQSFNDYIGEDAMWKLSETIKPRGGKKLGH